MKKLFLILSAAVALSSQVAAGGGKVTDEINYAGGDKTLIEQGLSLASLMREKAGSKTYLALLGGKDKAVNGKIREIAAGDVSAFERVYRVGGDFSEFVSMYAGDLGAGDSASFSPRLKKDFEKRFLAGFPEVWNGRLGTAEVTAASILASETAFESAELEADCLYIFTFKNAYPVTVSFLRGQGNAVSAKSAFVLNKQFTAGLSALLSEMDIGLKMERVR